MAFIKVTKVEYQFKDEDGKRVATVIAGNSIFVNVDHIRKIIPINNRSEIYFTPVEWVSNPSKDWINVMESIETIEKMLRACTFVVDAEFVNSTKK